MTRCKEWRERMARERDNRDGAKKTKKENPESTRKYAPASGDTSGVGKTNT